MEELSDRPITVKYELTQEETKCGFLISTWLKRCMKKIPLSSFSRKKKKMGDFIIKAWCTGGQIIHFMLFLQASVPTTGMLAPSGPCTHRINFLSPITPRTCSTHNTPKWLLNCHKRRKNLADISKGTEFGTD